jgi:hypothetical protein
MTAFYETIARYYDAEVGDKTDDLWLYSQLAETYGEPIFDVGCGTFGTSRLSGRWHR